MFVPLHGQLLAADHCAPLAPPSGDVVTVSTVSALVAAVDNAVTGRTILVANGYYALDGAYLRFDVPGVTLRGQSGSRDAVVIDGNYLSAEVIQIAASNVTIADLTVREAYDHPIHVMPQTTSSTLNTLIYNVRVSDPGQQAIKINPLFGVNQFVDSGTVACSLIELTDAGRSHIRDDCYTGGIDAHAALGWTVRDNQIEGFWCPAGLSEHAVHFWRSSRDTVVERNLLRDNARGVGFGLADSGTPSRSYADAPCPEAAGGYVDHYDGVVRNNMIAANSASLLASEYGFDCGICLWQACGASTVHNSVFSSNVAQSFSSIEWRFPQTRVRIANNLTNFTTRARDGATATLTTNLTSAQPGWFTSATTGNLHLTSAAASAVDHGTAGFGTDDFDGDGRPRGAAPDIGADETGPPTVSVSDMSVVEGDSGVVSATFRVSLSGSVSTPVEVDYTTTDSTAVAGTDYLAASGTLTLAPGATGGNVSVSVLGDTLPEWIESFRLNLTNPRGAELALAQAVGTIVDNDPPPSARFHTVSPCRRVDTRDPALGGTLPLAAGSDVRLLLAGGCGLPATAKAVSLNITATRATAGGDLRLYPGRTALPLVSVLNYSAGQTRANSAVVTLNDQGEIGVRVDQASGTVHVIVDVNGYFE